MGGLDTPNIFICKVITSSGRSFFVGSPPAVVPGPSHLEIILITPAIGWLVVASSVGWGRRSVTGRVGGSLQNLSRYPRRMRASISSLSWMHCSVLWPWPRWNRQYFRRSRPFAFKDGGRRRYSSPLISIKIYARGVERGV